MLPLFELENYLLRYETSAEYSLCASGMDSISLARVLSLADESSLAAWEALSLGYSPPAGQPCLADEISATYANLQASQVVQFSGAAEAIFCIFQALLSPDDHVVVVTPCYQSLYSIPASLCATTAVPLVEKNQQWHLPLEQLTAAMTSRTRAIIMNFPNNPTGVLLPPETLYAVVALARQYGAYLISDEVYRLMELEPARRLPAVAEIYERGVSIASLSKPYGAPGVRLGWIATQDAQIRTQLVNYRHYTTICSSAPGEWLALMILRAQAILLAEHHAFRLENLAKIEAFMQQADGIFSWIRPEGGCLAFPKIDVERLRHGSAWALAQALLQTEKVLVLPGCLYGWPEARWRVSYSGHSLPLALARLERFIARYI